MVECTEFTNSNQTTFAMYKNQLKVMCKIFAPFSCQKKYLSRGIHVNHNVLRMILGFPIDILSVKFYSVLQKGVHNMS